MGRIAVLLADHQAMVREGIAALLNNSDEMWVSAEAANGIGVMRHLEQSPADVVVMEFTLASQDSGSTIDFIRRGFPHTRLIILANPGTTDYALHMMETGANGYVLKSSGISELIQAIRTVHLGQKYISDEIKSEITQRLHNPRTQRRGIGLLSRREFQMLRLLARGSRISECAEQMCVSQSTASTYRARIMDKLNLRSTGEIIRYAVQQGISE